MMFRLTTQPPRDEIVDGNVGAEVVDIVVSCCRYLSKIASVRENCLLSACCAASSVSYPLLIHAGDVAKWISRVNQRVDIWPSNTTINTWTTHLENMS